MKRIITGIFIIFVLSAIVVGFRDRILVFTAEQLVGFISGAPVKIGELRLVPREKTIRVKNFRMYNPEGFPEGILLDLPEVLMDYSVEDIKKGKLHFHFIEAHVRELVAVRNAEGKLNVDELKFVKGIHGQEKQGGKVPVDLFRLTIDRVVYKDYTKGEHPSVDVYDVKIKDRNYRDLPGVDMVLALVVQEALTKTMIQGAAVYGLVAVAGATFWPAGAAIIVVGNDAASVELDKSPEEIFGASVKTLETIGKVTNKNMTDGVIKARVGDFDVAVKITPKEESDTAIKVSARKFYIPRPGYAKGILYQIKENL